MTSCHHFFPFLFSTWLVLLVLFLVPSIILAVDESTKEDDYDLFPAENMAAGQQKKYRVDNSTHDDSLKVLDKDDDMPWTFDCWVEFHDKTYVDSEERGYRQAVFYQNVAKWHILNQIEGGARYGPHNEPYADLSADEFIQVVANCYKEEEEEEEEITVLKKKKKNDINIGKEASAVEKKTESTASMSTTRHHLRHLRYSGATAMSYTRNVTGNSTSSTTWMRIDWRDHLGKSYVTPVKDQGPHGTCWSFGAAENLEGLGVRQGYDLTAISEQEFISCCPDCQGRSTDITFQWLIDNTNGHPALEESYPYEGNVTKCHKVDAPRSPLQLHSWGRIVDSEDGTGRIIEQGIFERGPMGLGVDASCFHGYRSGVVRNCSSRGINHAVLLVAAGTDIYWNSNQVNDEDNSLHSSLPTIVDFFTIKNSWSTGWGEAGYVRIEQGKDWWGPLDVIYTE